MLSIIIFASTLNTLIYDEKDLRIEDQPRSIYIVWFHRETILLLAPSLPPRSVDRSRGILFSRKGFNLEKTFTNLQSRPKKTCEEIKSVNPRRNFPSDSTSLRSIPQHPPLSLFYPSLCLSLFPLRPFDSARGRTTESRQQSEKRAAAKDTHRYAI